MFGQELAKLTVMDLVRCKDKKVSQKRETLWISILLIEVVDNIMLYIITYIFTYNYYLKLLYFVVYVQLFFVRY